jgi:hypothetical protein
MRNKKTDRILDRLHEEIEKLTDQTEASEDEGVDVIRRQIERANERLKTPPKKEWVH